MRVLLTGATGFVGCHLYHALVAAGIDVHCATRNPDAARSAHRDREWVRLDVEDEQSVDRALKGCDAAYYLIHGMGQGSDYPEREANSASNFSRAAARAGLRRIVYLGGVLPAGGRSSKHLESRERTGILLRSGTVSAIEMRAAMIIGEGSVSWTMVRDLAGRLPAMILPRWLRNHSYPVSIDDVVWGLLAALFEPGHDSRVFELPGPERISHRDVLQRVAALLGHTRPMVNVPVLTPRLSSYWIALVTRVSLSMAKELVEGVRYDLEPREAVLWNAVAHEPIGLEDAARLALGDEGAGDAPSASAVRRMRAIGAELEGDRSWTSSTERS